MALVEAMAIGVLQVGVEHDVRAALLMRYGGELVNEQLADSARAVRLIHHEVVDLQIAPAVELVADPIAAEADARITIEDSQHGVAMRHHGCEQVAIRFGSKRRRELPDQAKVREHIIHGKENSRFHGAKEVAKGKADNLPGKSTSMASHFLPDEQGSTERPGLIFGLGIFSFINTGLFLLAYGLGIFGMLALQQMPLEEVSSVFDQVRALMPEGDAEQVDAIVPILHANGALLMGILFVRTLLRLIGAVGIWRGRKSGFHLYAAAQLLGIFAPHIVLPWSMLGIMGPLLAVITTAAYGSQLKRMR